MTDLSEIRKLASYRPKHKVRFVTAASLFDGHDASINIMRRILQGMGAEVIHLGHNRSVEEIVTAALQEDVQGIAISSYQGGHVEFFKYMLDLLRERGGAGHSRLRRRRRRDRADEIKELHDYGVARIFSPEDGQKMGLAGMIGLMVAECDHDLGKAAPATLDVLKEHGRDEALALAGAADHRARTQRGRSEAHRSAAQAGRHREGPGAGSHRYRRSRQIEPDRRTGAPPAARPGRQARHRRDLDRPIAPQERRRAARRPHPDERDRPVERRTEGLHALARDARGRQRDQRGAAARDRGRQSRRLRRRHRRNLGHRPGRRGDRAARRPESVRDDAGVRRREPAREDRHARLRRLRRDQQVRPQGRGRRVARRQQAGAAEQGRLREEARRDAGVRHDGVALQRRRRHRAVPGAAAAAAGASA